MAQKHHVNLYFEGITKCPEKCMHKRTRITQSAAAQVTHNQMALMGKASRIVSQTVGMAWAKYFPTLFKDPALSSTMEEKTKKNNIRLFRELGCRESVMRGHVSVSFSCCYGRKPHQRRVRKEESVLVHSVGKVDHGREATTAEAGVCWSHCVHSQEVGSRKADVCLPPFHTIQDPNQGMVPPHVGWVSCFNCTVTAAHRQ